MNLLESLEVLAQRIEQLKDQVVTEEATKHSFVMPFFQALGYDVFDPNSVIPEFVADVGTKKVKKWTMLSCMIASLSSSLKLKNTPNVWINTHPNYIVTLALLTANLRF